MKADLNYSHSDCFQTFPFPKDLLQNTVDGFSGLSLLGKQFHEFREIILRERKEGLTRVFSRSNDPKESSSDVQKLRDLHVEMDIAVAAAYGWSDLSLDHGFHETKQGIRYTISELARREVLQRLLKLNHERYAEEEKQGLHGKKKGAAKKTTTKKPTSASPRKKKTPSKPEFQQPELFGEGEVE